MFLSPGTPLDNMHSHAELELKYRQLLRPECSMQQAGDKIATYTCWSDSLARDYY